MPVYHRLVAQLHTIDADSSAQADEIARIRAHALNSGLRMLGQAPAWAPTVIALDSEEGGLDDILQDAYLLDEVDDDPERNPRPGYVPLNETPVFELLLAWRDAAVRAAVDAAKKGR